MCLKYEPSSDPLHICVKQLFLSPPRNQLLKKDFENGLDPGFELEFFTMTPVTLPVALIGVPPLSLSPPRSLSFSLSLAPFPPLSLSLSFSRARHHPRRSRPGPRGREKEEGGERERGRESEGVLTNSFLLYHA